MICILYVILLSSFAGAESFSAVSVAISRKSIIENKVNISSQSISGTVSGSLAENNIDIQRNAVHSNISIKGATFQQSSIYIDGMKVDDPQTAHNNLNLPVAVWNIERIEVLHNKGLAGALNIITKVPENSIYADVAIGEFSSKKGAVSFSHAWGMLANTVSVEKSMSGGFAYDTDYDKLNITDKFMWSACGIEGNVYAGYLKKDMGARGFYADYPSYEWTETYLSKTGVEFYFGGVKLSPEIQWRRNNDEFELDIRKPGWSFNKHTTDVYSVKLGLEKNGFSGEINAADENIKSSNLGNHGRGTYSFFGDYKYEIIENLVSVAGLQYNKFGVNSVILPKAELSYSPEKNTRIYSYYRKSSRYPSFTELYYADRANKGNADLKYEKADLYGAGVSWNAVELDLFLRDEKSIIDWIKYSKTDSVWNAVNIGTARFYGIEIRLEKNIGAFGTKIKYSYTDSSKDADYISKYALRYARHLAVSEISCSPGWNIKQIVNGMYKKRVTGEEYFVMSTAFLKKSGKLEYYINVENLLNRKYTEIPYVPMPPRTASAGIKMEF